MRLFQNSGVNASYLPRLRRLTAGCSSFAAHVDAFLNDRYGAAHFLQPVLERDPSAFFANGDEEVSERFWAHEQGLPRNVSIEAILLAQIEQHRADVFYNIDPMRYGSEFVRKLPGCVKKTVAWRAAPSPGADFEAYDLVVCNFPSILRSYQARGWSSAYFSPAHDPVMDAYAANTERPIDVLFVGGYSRHHRRRAGILEAVAARNRELKIVFHLDQSRLTRWAESAVGPLLPLGRHRRPPGIRRVSQAPIFGLDLYAALSRAKIVLNGAVDMAGGDRGNMRCFEATGCGSLLLSDQGNYPEGFVPDVTFLSYESADSACHQITSAINNYSDAAKVSRRGWTTVRSVYSKERQWRSFQQIVANA